MQTTTVALIGSAVLFSVVGQVLLKAGAQQLAGSFRLGFLLSAGSNAHVLLGLFAWVVSSLCWLYALRVAPLSRAYALTSFTYVLVPLAGVLRFGEEVNRVHGTGMALIALGVALLLVGD